MPPEVSLSTMSTGSNDSSRESRVPVRASVWGAPVRSSYLDTSNANVKGNAEKDVLLSRMEPQGVYGRLLKVALVTVFAFGVVFGAATLSAFVNVKPWIDHVGSTSWADSAYQPGNSLLDKPLNPDNPNEVKVTSASASLTEAMSALNTMFDEACVTTRNAHPNVWAVNLTDDENAGTLTFNDSEAVESLSPENPWGEKKDLWGWTSLFRGEAGNWEELEQVIEDPAILKVQLAPHPESEPEPEPRDSARTRTRARTPRLSPSPNPYRNPENKGAPPRGRHNVAHGGTPATVKRRTGEGVHLGGERACAREPRHPLRFSPACARRRRR